MGLSDKRQRHLVELLASYTQSPLEAEEENQTEDYIVQDVEQLSKMLPTGMYICARTFLFEYIFFYARLVCIRMDKTSMKHYSIQTTLNVQTHINPGHIKCANMYQSRQH